MRQLIQIFRIDSYSMRKSSDIDPCIFMTTSPATNKAWASKSVRRYSSFNFDILIDLGCFSGIGQLHLLLALTYPSARCTLGYTLIMEWVQSWLLETGVADVNRFFKILNILAVKSLLVLRLRAIWNKDLIGKRACNMGQWTRYIDFWILVTLVLYFMTAGMFCRIWFMIDRGDWWS